MVAVFSVRHTKGVSHVDVFGIMGFIFGIIAFGTASSAQAQIAALKQEVEMLKAAQQGRSE